MIMNNNELFEFVEQELKSSPGYFTDFIQNLAVLSGEPEQFNEIQNIWSKIKSELQKVAAEGEEDNFIHRYDIADFWILLLDKDMLAATKAIALRKIQTTPNFKALMEEYALTTGTGRNLLWSVVVSIGHQMPSHDSRGSKAAYAAIGLITLSSIIMAGIRVFGN
jgi:hypothetical protein